MMRRRFVRHPRGYAGYRPVGLRNYDQLCTTVGVLPDNEHDLAATGMERVVNPPLDQVLAGSMSLLRTTTQSSTVARLMRIGPRSSASGTCCAYGSPRREPDRYPQCLRNAFGFTARQSTGCALRPPERGHQDTRA